MKTMHSDPLLCPQGLYPCDRRESISTRRICFPEIDFTMVRIVNLTPILRSSKCSSLFSDFDKTYFYFGHR